MAEALLRVRLARDEARRDWQVESAGVWTSDGNLPSRGAVEEMARGGIDLRSHRSRNITLEMVARADVVLVMTRHHAEALAVAFPDHSPKIHLLSEMAGPAYDIEDPYGGTAADYAATAHELERLIEAGYERIVALVEGRGPAGG